MRLSFKSRGGGRQKIKRRTQNGVILYNFRVYIVYLSNIGYRSSIGIAVFVPNLALYGVFLPFSSICTNLHSF